MSEIDTRIHSPELASEMAYAEKPYRDLQHTATQLGALSVEAIQSLNDQANAKGIEAAQSYIAGLQANIAAHTYGVTPEATEPEPSFSISRTTFYEYAEAKGHSMGFASQIFNALCREAYNPSIGMKIVASDSETIVNDTSLVFSKPVAEMAPMILEIRYIGKKGIELISGFAEEQNAQSELADS